MSRHPGRRHSTTPQTWIGLCRATGKRMYPSRKAARREARRIDPTMGAYRCTACDWHHVGHETADTKAWIRSRGHMQAAA